MIRQRLWDFCGMTLGFGKLSKTFRCQCSGCVISRVEGHGETVVWSLAPFPSLYSPGLAGLQPLAVRRT
jgi:hypothetical protein